MNFLRSDAISLKPVLWRRMGPLGEGKRDNRVPLCKAGLGQLPDPLSREQSLLRKRVCSLEANSRRPCSWDAIWRRTETCFSYPEWVVLAKSRALPIPTLHPTPRPHPRKRREKEREEKRKKTNKGNKWIYRMHLAATRISRSCQSKRLYGIQQMLLGLEQLTRILFPKRSWEREAL